MNDNQLVASPNWYSSCISDVSVDGLFAFGARNTIFLLDLAGAASCPTVVGQLCGHKDKVTSVRFCKASAYSRLCVSGSEDHSVMIWDVDAKACVCKHGKHQSKVTALYWSSLSADWIVSGDEAGHILAWNHQVNQVYEHAPMHGYIFCISCSPEEEGIVVVGYKTGQILVLLLKDEKYDVVSLLKGHNDEIHSLVWSPVRASQLPREIFGVANKQENGYILASGSRDKTIRLWDVSTSQSIAVVNIPSRTSARRTARDEQHSKSRMWATLCWSEAHPKCLVSSGNNGDILLWDLSKSSNEKCQLLGKGKASGHSRVIFNICQYAARDIIVSVSMDRLIIVWRKNDGKILYSLPTLGGFGYSLDISFMDPSSVAVGVGDNMIRIWETSSTKEYCAVETLWRGIGSKVMKVLWHPVKEGVLAFGTEEGKVGVYNVMTQTCSVYRTYHKKSVYSLSWGPPSASSDNCSSDKAVWHLYSCGGEGVILEHKLECPNIEAQNINKLVKTTNNIKHNLAGHSEVSWKPDRSVVAIGSEDGSIHIYRAPDLKLLSTINVHNKSITCLSWSQDVNVKEPRKEKKNQLGLNQNIEGEHAMIADEKQPRYDIESLIHKETPETIKNNQDHVASVQETAINEPGKSHNASLQFLSSTVEIHRQGISGATVDEEEPSGRVKELDSFLASSSNGFDVHVHDLRNIIDADEKALGNQAVVINSFKRLVGHSGRVTNVAWCPHMSLRLASSSYDGTVQVWDVLKGEGLANYRGHNGRVMSVVWSIIDADVVFSGGEDFTVRCWRISQQRFKEPPVEAKKPAKSKGKKKKKKAVDANYNMEEDQLKAKPAIIVDERKLPRDTGSLNHDEKPEAIKDNQDFVTSESVINETSESHRASLQFLSSASERNQQGIFGAMVDAEEPSLNVKADSKRRKRKGKSLFPLSACADNRSRTITSKECVEIAKVLHGNKDVKGTANQPERSINLGLFTDRESAFSMLNEEGIHHFKNGNIDYQLQLEVWKGNVGKALELAVEKKELSHWLVSISHLAGEEARLAVTEAYAEQLASQENYHSAALYYLACHKVYDAIDMFKTAGMYRDAIALAKVRLLPSDPVLLDIYSSWGRRLENECSYEQAAKCYLACGLNDDAIRVLARRSDESDLVAAAEIARLTGKMDLSESFILQCALTATRDARWNDALQMVHNYSNMQPLLMQMYTHKVLVVSLMDAGAITQEDFPEMEQVESFQRLSELPYFVRQLKAQYTERMSSDLSSHWGPVPVNHSYFIYEILESWWSSCGLNVDEKRLYGFYVQIAAFKFGQTTSTKEGVAQVSTTVSKEVCLALLASLVGQPELCLDHFLKAIVKCHDCGHLKLLRNLFNLLFPCGLESWYMIKGLSQSPTLIRCKNVDQLFCNIIAFYYRALLKETLNKCDRVVKESLVYDQRDQNQSVKEQICVEGLQLIGIVNEDVQSTDTFPSNDDRSLNNGNPVESKIESSPQGDLEFSKTESFQEIVGQSVCTVKGMTCSDVHKVAMVASTVLLSEVHARLQCGHESFKEVQNELGAHQMQGLKLVKDSSIKGNELEIWLSKFPFPDVIEGARMIVDVCVNALKICSDKERADFLELLQQVVAWAIRHNRNPDHKSFFESAFKKLSGYLEV